MSATLINFARLESSAPRDLGGLQAQLTRLVGEPFQFARVSYGDELTLHFGDLRPARSPKLKDYQYGAYILGVRASTWLVKSSSIVVASHLHSGDEVASLGEPLSNVMIEAKPVFEPGNRVVAATPFVLKPAISYGLQLTTSDGTTLIVLPISREMNADPDVTLPELADWELIVPGGLLSAGPGLDWTFRPDKT